MEFEYRKKLHEALRDLNCEDVPEGEIRQLFVRKLDIFEDDRGYLSEICRTDWAEVGLLAEEFKQVYIIGNWEKKTIRAYHKHEKLVDFFIVVNGSAKFVCFDDRPESESFGNIQTIIASAKNMKMITVPAGVYHGWQSLEENTILVSVANHLYMGVDKKGELDEHRIPYDTFGKDIWEVEYK